MFSYHHIIGYIFIGAKQLIQILPYLLCELKSTFDTLNSKSVLHFDDYFEMTYHFCIKIFKNRDITNVIKTREKKNPS